LSRSGYIDEMPALVAARYRLGEPVGRGGMGRVWRAHDQVLDRVVAVKEIVPPPALADPEGVHRRTLREARATARLNHPAVVRVFDVLEVDGGTWIVMEYVPSRSLQEVIAADGPLPSRRVAKIGLDLLAALVAAARAGVEHRDVKPANVLLADDGRVMLTDFGIAAIADDPSTSTSDALIGSPEYMPPERAQSKHLGLVSDLWSLGATLYTAVEGRSPFRRATIAATLTAITVSPPEAPTRAGALAPLLEALLQKDPADRPSAKDAARMLRSAASGAYGRASIPAPDVRDGTAPAEPGAVPGPSLPGTPPADPGPAPGSGPRGAIAPGTDRSATGTAGKPPASPGEPPASAERSGVSPDAAPSVLPAGGPSSASPAAPATGPSVLPARAEPSSTSPDTPAAGPSPDVAVAGPPPDSDSPDASAARPSSGSPAVAADEPPPSSPAAAVPAAVSAADEVPVSPDADGRSRVSREGAGGAAPAVSPDAAGRSVVSPDAAMAASPAAVDAPPVAEPESAPERAPAAEPESGPGPMPVTVPAPGFGQATTKTGPGRKWLVVAAVVLVVLLAAGGMLWLLDDRSPAKPTPSAASQPPVASPSAAPASSTAAPTSASPTPSASPKVSSGSGRPALPGGWKDYHDKTGFAIYVPEGWSRSQKGSMVYFRGDGRVLGIDQSSHPKSDPLADWREKASYRVSAGDFPRYHLVRMVPVDYLMKSADWEYTFDGGSGRQHVDNRNILASSHQAYAIYWQTSDASWSAHKDDLALVYASFRPKGKAD
jgi:serine/threonine protein kinase